MSKKLSPFDKIRFKYMVGKRVIVKSAFEQALKEAYELGRSEGSKPLMTFSEFLKEFDPTPYERTVLHKYPTDDNYALLVRAYKLLTGKEADEK